MMTTAWQLAATRLQVTERYRKWAHALGYGGHCLTKSRRYSVTFGQLRRARAEHRRLLRHPDGEHDPWGRPLDETTVLVLNLELRRSRPHHHARRRASARLRRSRPRSPPGRARRIGPSRHDQPSRRNHCP